MPSLRRGVIETVYTVLSSSPHLAGIEVLGSTAELDSLPVPCVVLTLGGSTPIQHGVEWTWDIGAEVYARDVFEAADVLDALDRTTFEFRQQAEHGVKLAYMRSTGHEELDAPLPGSGFQKLSAARASISVRWVTT